MTVKLKVACTPASKPTTKSYFCSIFKAVQAVDNSSRRNCVIYFHVSMDWVTLAAVFREDGSNEKFRGQETHLNVYGLYMYMYMTILRQIS